MLIAGFLIANDVDSQRKSFLNKETISCTTPKANERMLHIAIFFGHVKPFPNTSGLIN